MPLCLSLLGLVEFGRLAYCKRQILQQEAKRGFASQIASFPNLPQQVIDDFAKMPAFDASIDPFITIHMVKTTK